jgi:hypothetical protein
MMAYLYNRVAEFDNGDNSSDVTPTIVSTLNVPPKRMSITIRLGVPARVVVTQIMICAEAAHTFVCTVCIDY